MNRLFWIIVLSLFLFVSVFLHTKNYLEHREVVQLTKTILNYWLKDDLSKTYIYWAKETETPPIYGLISYEIKGHILGKKDGVSYAQVYATFELTPSNLLPSDKEWVFEIIKTRYGWKVKDLHPNYEKPKTVSVEDRNGPPPAVEGVDLSTSN